MLRVLVCMSAAVLAGCGAGTREPQDPSPIEVAREAGPPAVSGQELNQRLIVAAFHGDVALVRDCLSAGTKIDSRYGGSSEVFRGENGGSPLAGSAWTALHAAANGLHPTVVQVLIDAGADLNLDDGYGATALYMSVDVYDRTNQKDECALLLIEAGAKVNTTTGIYIDGIGGHTPLHRAVVWNQKRAVFALIKAGANVNARNDGGSTPLHDAYLCDADQSIIAALLAAGADSNAKDDEGRVPTFWN